MQIPNACMARAWGHIVLDKENKKAWRVCVKEVYDFLVSKTYEEKAGVFWPHVYKNNPIPTHKLLPQGDKYRCVEIEYIEHIIHWPEMSSTDIKKCHLTMLDMLEYLLDNGWTAMTHVWNMVLQGGKPIHLDLGDFKRAPDPNSLATKRYIVASMVSVFDRSLNNSDDREAKTAHIAKTAETWIQNASEIVTKLKNINDNCQIDTKSIIAQIREALNNIKPSSGNLDVWDSYPVQLNMPKTLDEIINYTPNTSQKSRALCEVIEKKLPKTLVDVGCSRGLYSFFAASKGATCVGLDNHHSLISDANKRAIKLGVNCSFAVIDFLNIKSYGIKGSYGNCLTRFKSEAVIAPAILHHLSGKNKTTKQLVTEMVSMAEKWVMLEYIPGFQIDYDAVISTCKELGFTEVDVMDSFPPDRKWIFAEKKGD